MESARVIEGLRAAHAAIDARRVRVVEVVEIADAVVMVDATRDGEFPSNCPNRVEFLGTRGAVEDGAIDEIVLLYRSRGVKRFFVWVTPTAHTHGLAERLAARGMTEWPWVRYPTLVRAARGAAGEALREGMTLRVRRVGEGDRSALEAAVPDVYGEVWSAGLFLRSLGDEAFDHFAAFDGETIVAASVLVTANRCGYLSYAATREEHRGRGAQRAMIAARIARAAERWCEVCIAETLSILEVSLSNLRRAGFEEAYVTRVFLWTEAGTRAGGHGGT